MSWWWRTKPRSIIRTVQWFNEFGKLNGKNWDFEDKVNVSCFNGAKIHPVRREYIYAAHAEEDNHIRNLSLFKYKSGQYDVKETESNGRNDKTTFEFFGFGYVDDNGIIQVTKVGKRILENHFDGEDYLKQLLKLQFPNVISSGSNFNKDEYIFPMELILKAFEKFESLNRSELVLLFGCNSMKQSSTVFDGINEFKEKYKNLLNKNNISDVKQLCKEM